MNRRNAWALLVAANVLGYCMLSYYQATAAAPPAQLPFANSTEQRLEMVQELREIKELLKEQNALLRSGEVKVFIAGLAKQGQTAAAPVENGAAAENQEAPAQP